MTIGTNVGNGADTYISGDWSNTTGTDESTLNYGSADYVRVSKNYWDADLKAYLRFDLSGLPSGATITSAQLVMRNRYWGSNNMTGYFYGSPDGSTGDGLTDWSESTITYNNAPYNVASGDGFTGVTYIGQTSLSGYEDGDNILADTRLADLLNADTNGLVTIMFVNNTNGWGTEFRTKELNSTQMPRLEIEYIPEPATMGLLSVGAVGMLLRRRSRQA